MLRPDFARRPSSRLCWVSSPERQSWRPLEPGPFSFTGRRVASKPELEKEDAMTKRSEAKYKIDRRMGQNIWGRPKSPVNRREYGPGQHGQRRKGKLSDFGVQLRAKQKLKGYYANITEKQFRRYYAEAIRLKGDSGAHLI